MRRIVVGSILLGWIAFLAGVVVRGIEPGAHGLLHEMQVILIESPAISLTLETARAILTGAVVLTLTIALWALMFAMATNRSERAERVMSLGAAFSFVLFVSAVAQLTAILTGAPQVIAMLFAIQMATLVSMLAAGGVEIAWDLVSEKKVRAGEEIGHGHQVADVVPAFRRRLALFGSVANDQGAR